MTVVHPVAAVLRDMISQYMGFYALQIRAGRTAGLHAVDAMVDGLSGVTALQIVGGHVSQEEAEAQVVKLFRESLQRDLQHLTRQ